MMAMAAVQESEKLSQGLAAHLRGDITSALRIYKAGIAEILENVVLELDDRCHLSLLHAYVCYYKQPDNAARA